MIRIEYEYTNEWTREPSVHFSVHCTIDQLLDKLDHIVSDPQNLLLDIVASNEEEERYILDNAQDYITVRWSDHRRII